MSNSRLIRAGIAFASSILLLNFVFFPAEVTAATELLDDEHEHSHDHDHYIDETNSVIPSHDVTYTLDEEENVLRVEEVFTVYQEDLDFGTVLSFSRQFEYLDSTYELSYSDWILNGEDWQVETTDLHHRLVLDVGSEPEDFVLEYTLDGSFFENQYEGVSTLLFPANGWEYGKVESSSALLVGIPADSAITCIPDCEYSPEPDGLLFSQTASPMSLEVFFLPGTVVANAEASDVPVSDGNAEEDIVDEEDRAPVSELSPWQQLDTETKLFLVVIVISGVLSLLVTRLYFASKRKRRRKKLEKAQGIKAKKKEDGRGK